MVHEFGDGLGDVDSSIEHGPLPTHNKLFQILTQDFM